MQRDAAGSHPNYAGLMLLYYGTGSMTLLPINNRLHTSSSNTHRADYHCRLSLEIQASDHKEK